jgi:hypothetical protein
MATLIEESFRTWEFLIFMAKKVIKESCHDGLIKDSSGQQVDLATIPTPGEYTWVRQGEREQDGSLVAHCVGSRMCASNHQGLRGRA